MPERLNIKAVDEASEVAGAAGNRALYESDPKYRHELLVSGLGEKNDQVTATDLERMTTPGFGTTLKPGLEATTPSGATVEYSSRINGLAGKTEIVRHLPGGGEYRHTSESRQMANKVGQLAIKKIVERNQEKEIKKAA